MDILMVLIHSFCSISLSAQKNISILLCLFDNLNPNSFSKGLINLNLRRSIYSPRKGT